MFISKFISLCSQESLSRGPVTPGFENGDLPYAVYLSLKTAHHVLSQITYYK